MLIKNGFLIDPASDTERLVDLRITDGLIQTLADAGTLTPENGEDELDAAGLMISPGLVDTHIHFRDPGFTYKEDLHTGSLAAAAPPAAPAGLRPDNTSTQTYQSRDGPRTTGGQGCSPPCIARSSPG